MATLEQIDFARMFTLLKGEPGTRKSTAALSYPKPMYWFDWDQKMEALALPAQKWGIDLKEVEYDSYSNFDKPKQKIAQFQLNCKYKTLVIDSITSAGDAINRQTLGFKDGQKDGGAYKIAGISVNTMEDYKAETAGFQEMIAMLKDVANYHKIHIVLSAHVIGQRKDDPNNNLTSHSRILVTGSEKAAAKIPAYCTEAYHFNTKNKVDTTVEGDYACVTRHTGNDFARTSLDLPREIVFNDKPLFDTWIKPAILKMQPTYIKHTCI